jgi:hypothetical protein
VSAAMVGVDDQVYLAVGEEMVLLSDVALVTA